MRPRVQLAALAGVYTCPIGPVLEVRSTNEQPPCGPLGLMDEDRDRRRRRPAGQPTQPIARIWAMRRIPADVATPMQFLEGCDTAQARMPKGGSCGVESSSAYGEAHCTEVTPEACRGWRTTAFAYGGRFRSTQASTGRRATHLRGGGRGAVSGAAGRDLRGVPPARPREKQADRDARGLYAQPASSTEFALGLAGFPFLSAVSRTFVYSRSSLAHCSRPGLLEVRMGRA